MQGLRITQATMDEFDTVTDLHVAMNREMARYSHACPEGALERSAISYLVSRHLRRDDFCVWMACLDSEVVGFISGAVLESPVPSLEYTVGTISNLYVAPRFRRSGVGTALVDHLLEVFEGYSVAHVELSYLVRNEPARDFWARRGFVPESIKAVLPLSASDEETNKPENLRSEPREVREVR